jgi:hypothetical protein
MIYLLAGLLLFFALIVFARWAAYASPTDLVRVLYRIGGILLGFFALFLFFRRAWFFAVPVAIMAWALLRKQPAGAGAQREGGRGSTVRSAMLEMILDHDTGIIIGRVLAGHFEGRDLDGLSEAEQAALWEELAQDRDSRDLFEAYLDGRRPGWRDEFEADMATGERGATQAGPMTEQEAYQVLGLAPGASDSEIVAAHRRLMVRLHPDKGGSTFLAAKINAAKSVLLDKHG